MPLENAVTIDQLLASNPTDMDPMAEGSGQIRLIKECVLGSFPKLVGPTQVLAADLDLLAATNAASAAATAAYVGTKGTQTIADLVTTDTATPPVTTTVPGSLTTSGFVNSASIQKAGNELVPTGIICMWYGSTTNVPAGWHLCDGTTGTPDLRDRFVVAAGLTFAPYAIGGEAIFVGDSVNAGTHSHGTATGFAGGHSHTGSASAAGAHNHGGADGSYNLTLADIPSHDHFLSQIPVTTLGAGGGTFGALVQNGASVGPAGVPTDDAGGGGAHSHSIATDGNHAHPLAVDAVGDHQHGIAADGDHFHVIAVPTVPPFVALCLIMKL